MKKLFVLIPVLALSFSAIRAQSVYAFRETMVTFFSETPIENIEAKNKNVIGALNTTTNEVAVKVTNLGFIFEKPLMQEHFHENYMESKKYPESLFKGSIVEKVDWTKDGETPVTVKGKMTIHGVTKDVEMKGKVTIKGGKISIHAKFPVKVADYGIKVPTIVVKNIAEVVDVTITSNLELVPPKKN